MDQHTHELKKLLEYIPRRILELTFEIDKLKIRFQEAYEEYNEITAKEQKEIIDSLDKSLKQVTKEEFIKGGKNRL